MSQPIEAPVSLFYSYAHEDEPFRNELEKHLAVLRRTGVIAPWHDRRITAGHEWADEIDRYLESAQVILLLVSADFLASDYCWGVEMNRALARHDAGDARVIPVMVRPVDFFSGVPFARLQALPRDARPITEWPNKDAAWADVARGIRLACSEVQQRVAKAASISAPARGETGRPPGSADRGRVPPAAPVRPRNEEELGEFYTLYWAAFSAELQRSDLRLRPPSATTRNYARISLGSSDMRMNVFASVRDRFIGMELVLKRPACDDAYLRLKSARAAVEREFGRPLDWNELQGSFRIALVERGHDPVRREAWSRQHQWLLENLKRFQAILVGRVTT